jgi:hypothetical protein
MNKILDKALALSKRKKIMTKKSKKKDAPAKDAGVMFTDEQKDMKKQIEEEYDGVRLTFDTPETWVLHYRGKEDSGHISAGVNGIRSSIARMKAA